jgi:hypothetical protein
MRARLAFVVVLVAVGSLSAQQGTSSNAAGRPAGAGRESVSPGIGGAPPGVPAPTPAEAATIAEVKAFEKRCDDAAVTGDVAFLERALSRDFIMTHGDGWTTGGMPIKVDTKKSWLEYVARQPLPYVYRNLDSIQVELHGDLAITVGRYRYLPRTNALPNPPNPSTAGTHLFVWFERVYAKRNGEWQFVSHRTVNGPNREPDDRVATNRQ